MITTYYDGKTLDKEYDGYLPTKEIFKGLVELLNPKETLDVYNKAGLKKDGRLGWYEGARVVRLDNSDRYDIIFYEGRGNYDSGDFTLKSATIEEVINFYKTRGQWKRESKS